MGKQGTKEIFAEYVAVVLGAFLLSFIVIIKMPYGGGVTAACMLPIIIFSYRLGLLWGFASAFSFSILQLIAGYHNLSYADDVVGLIEMILLDYVVAYSLTGIVGFWRRDREQTSTLLVGAFLTCFLRFMCHVMAGATVWVDVSIPTFNGMTHSFLYNMAYMIPETLVTMYAVALVSCSFDLRKNKPALHQSEKSVTAVLYASLLFGIAVVLDFIYLFGKIQTKDGFDVTGIKNANASVLGLITALGLAAALVVYFILMMQSKKERQTE